MRFLNDKFFRAAVITFLLFLALPFIFSTPQERREGRKRYSDSVIVDTFYQAFDKISKFYGFKKDDSVSSLPKSNILKSNSAENRENKEQNPENKQAPKNNSSEEIPASVNNDNSSSNEKSQQEANTSSNYSNYAANNKNAQLREYVVYNNSIYPVLKNKNGDMYIHTENGPISLKSLPRNTKRFFAQNIGVEQNQNNTQQYVLTQGNTQESSFNKKHNNAARQYREDNFAFAKNQKPAKGSFGQNYFSSPNNKSQDLYKNFNDSLKDIQKLKLNKEEKSEQKEENNIIVKTYRVSTYNPQTKKNETRIVKQEITKQDEIVAEEIKKETINRGLTPSNQATENSNKIQDKNTKLERVIPSVDELKDSTPHDALYFTAITQEIDIPIDKLSTSYDIAQKAANNLPKNKEEFPFLEFITGTDKQQKNVIRGDENSFNVQAIKIALKGRVATITNDNNINFEDIQKRIYVVPNRDIQEYYKQKDIPVILYPDLNPFELQTVYETIPEAIETLNKNKQKAAKNMTNDNKREIEALLQ